MGAANFEMQGKLQLWKRQECKIGGYRRDVDKNSRRLEHDTVTSGPLMSGNWILKYWALWEC
jgi:hypothetical protein